MKKENIAIVEMLICATLWSIAGIFIKLIPWNGFAIAGMRSLIAGLTFVVYMLITRKRYVLSKKSFFGGVMTAGVYTCFVVANKLTTAANAIVLQFTSPVFIVVLSAIFLKQKIRKQDIAVVSATFVGIALFFFDKLQPGYILGNCVAILAGLFMAVMFIVVGTQEGDERYSTILNGQFFTFLVGVPSIIMTRPEFTPAATLSILVLGVFQLGISYILYVRATKYCPALACCLLGALEPLLNPVWVLIFDGERPGVFALVGGVIVIVSITIWCIFDAKKEPVKREA